MSSLEADHKFLKKSAWFNIIGTVLKICGPLLTVLLARIFGAAEFGIFVSTQTLLLTIARSATLGLDKGLHWYLPRNKLHNRPAFEGIMESFWISVLIAFLCTVVIFIGSFTPLISAELPWYALSLVFYSASFVLSNTSEGNRRPQNAIFINSFFVAVLSPAVSILLHFLNIPHPLPLGLLFGQIGGFILHAILVRRQFSEMPVFPGKKISKDLLFYSLPLGFNEFVSAFLIRSGLWMVLLFLGPEKAGAYAIMVTLSNGLQTIRVGFTPILTPVVAGMNKERLYSDLKPVLTYCISMITLIQLVIGFFIVLFPDEILSLAGNDFIVQPEALGILLLIQLLLGFWGMALVIMNGIGKSFYTLKMNIFSLGVALISGYFLIPAFGLVGAALSMLSYNVVSMVWNNIYLAKLGLWPYSAKLWVQLLWIVLLLVTYIVLNFGGLTLNVWQKIVFYLVVLAALGFQLWLRSKRSVKPSQRM
ncbi:MAG: oligosaccharide flippase family protein [Fibrobacter sp.]|jgi:O-antigen/teichoic acid export membrane protein|nr:oligosaccharide flippase family protein [Fibrobacter sp.]